MLARCCATVRRFSIKNVYKKNDQTHILKCTVLNPEVEHETVHSDIYEEGDKQEISAKVFAILIRQRKRLLEKDKDDLPGDNLDQCAPRGAAPVPCV